MTDNESGPEITRQVGIRQVKLTWACDIEPEPVRWAWEDAGAGRIPSGSLSIAAGREGTGKSSFGIWMTAQLSRGTLSGSQSGKPKRTLYVAVEDSWRYTLVPRLMAAKADLSMVARFEVVTIADDDREVGLTLSLPFDNDLLKSTIIGNDVGLVVIDPLMSVIGSSIDTHRNREVRDALDPLVRIADDTGAVILGIAHFNKSSGTDAASLISGSGAFKDVPRSVFGFARDDENETRVITQVKNSLGRDDLPSRTYTIESVRIETKKGVAETGRFVFTGESERTVAEVLRDNNRGLCGGSGMSAADFIATYLIGAGGTAPANEVIAAGELQGFKEQTLKNARSQVADSRHAGSGEERAHYWTLKENPRKTDSGTRSGTSGTTHLAVVPEVPKSVSESSRAKKESPTAPNGIPRRRRRSRGRRRTEQQTKGEQTA